jgi:hypothetical protein
MTVKELIKVLKNMPQGLEVMTEYDYGDRCHTRALNKIESADVLSIKETAYSDSGLAVDEDDGNGEVVVLGQ